VIRNNVPNNVKRLDAIPAARRNQFFDSLLLINRNRFRLTQEAFTAGAHL
jgi:hypothetical protein